MAAINMRRRLELAMEREQRAAAHPAVSVQPASKTPVLPSVVVKQVSRNTDGTIDVLISLGGVP